MVSPASSSRASRLQRYVTAMAAEVGLAEHWEWPLAARLSQIGCVTLPKEILSKVDAGQVLDEPEQRLYDLHPELASKLLAAVPRLEDVAAIVAAQAKPVSGDLPSDVDIRATGQMLLHAAREFDRLIVGGIKPQAAAEQLRLADGGVPTKMAQALASLSLTNLPWVIRQITLRELAPGMFLEEDDFNEQVYSDPAFNGKPGTLELKGATRSRRRWNPVPWRHLSPLSLRCSGSSVTPPRSPDSRSHPPRNRWRYPSSASTCRMTAADWRWWN